MRTVGALVLVGAVLGSACASEGASNDTLRVVASFFPVAEAAERIGGERVDVHNLTPPGVEPHDVELDADQVDAIEDADVVVFVEGDFQPAITTVAERRDAGNVVVGSRGADPHFWLDPQRMAQAVDDIAAAMAQAAPADGRLFRDNAESYKAELTRLDVDFRQGLQECERHEVVTAHDAFGQLAARYGLTQFAIAGVSPDTEPNAARLAELADVIKQKGVTTVFFEELTSPDVAEALAREAKVRTAVLSPVEGLTDEQRDDGATYLSVMRDNLNALREALGCR